MVRVDVNLLDKIAFACKRYPERAVDITQSFKFNQIKSKETVQRLLPSTSSNICVLGGWYGLGLMITTTNIHKYTCVDVDPVCEKIGKILDYPNFSFITADALTYDTSRFDVIINCSTEHMDKELLLRSFENISDHTLCVLQNNNNFNVPDHINCFETVDNFESYVSNHFGILETITDTMDNGTTRYTLLCRRMR